MHASMETTAVAYFQQGFLCSESVVLSAAQALRKECACLPALATGLGAGLGCTGGMCGLLSGGILALGLKYGRTQGDQDFGPCMGQTQQFMGWFAERFGSTHCNDLLGCDVSTPEGQAEAKQRFEEGNVPCLDYCREVAAYLEKALAE